MELTNRRILEAEEAVTILGGQRLPVRLSFDVSKLKIAMSTAAKPIRDTRKKLVEDYSKKDENDKPLLKKDSSGNATKEADIEDLVTFEKAFNVLMDVTAEVATGNILQLPELTACSCEKCHHNMDEPMKIEPNVLAALDGMVEMKD